MLLYICVVLICASVYVSGDEQLPLLGNDVQDYDTFGYATALYGNRAAVTSFGANRSVGAVYTFEVSLTSGTWVQTAKLTPFDAQIDTNFGNSLSMYENRLVIGAWADDRDGQTNVGAVYVYEYFESSSGSTNSSGWTFTQKLVGPEAQSEFGNAVSLYQDRLIIGAVSYKNWMGCAYIYTLDKQSSTWVLEKQLIPADAHTSGLYQDTQMYGTSVTMYGDTAVVGAAWDNNSTGAVYAYEYNSGAWTETKIVAKGLSDTDYFGVSVSIYDRTLVVGSPGDNTPMGLNSGSIYVFQKSDNGSWGQIAHITASDGAASDTFGAAVDITEKFIVAASPYKTNVENNVPFLGATYLFTIDYTSNAITPFKKLVPVDPLSQMNGYSLSAFGDTVLVGAECAHTEAIPLYYNLL